MKGQRGFSLVEVMVSVGLMLAVMASVFGLLHPAEAAFAVHPEAADMQQRLRTAAGMLYDDLLAAGAGISGVPAIMPYRAGPDDPDPPGTFRPDVITIAYVPHPGSAPAITRTYYLRTDAASGAPQMARYEGAILDVPVADHVVDLRFQYFDADGNALEAPVLTDGPWVPDAISPDRFDEHLMLISSVQVLVRVEAAPAALRGAAGVLFARGGTAGGSRFLPDRELRFVVAPRNLNGR